MKDRESGEKEMCIDTVDEVVVVVLEARDLKKIQRRVSLDTLICMDLQCLMDSFLAPWDGSCQEH